ncbi:CLUMA_CG019437, isoform A [Clunio marinus]|uniref:Solute carrier family 12 member 8 n=1 Tax=Clunio marinus TaxID=568069 RepID=A0A1J1J3H7_9DIPT|nr:CLUMA_CG019437, isoform A [Clunio marinus]
MTTERRNMNWDRFGLDSDDIPRTARARHASGGFVDLGNESEFAVSGHQPSGPDEMFANEQGDKPWWRSHFFISQPTLFGKWDGVFTTCMVNIFGVIVFLRSGWIVGQAGILHSIMVIVCSVGIALISVLSAIGIVERIRVETGGVYFLIAHTLGSRFGGSLGLLYCFGQAVGCALNVLGFGESMAGLVHLEHSPGAIRGFAAAAVILLGTINVAGVKWVVKLQFALLIILLLSALDFMVGSFITDPSDEGFQGWGSGNFVENLWPAYQDGISWFTVFGVFFPTITGVLSGINMSGDLRAPSTDIPNGTLAALSTSTFLYMVFMIFLGATVQRETLLHDFMITSHVSAINFLLLAGIYVSSMSSCLGAMYGTPRVLQSIANESVIPGMGKLGTGRGPNKVPLNAMGIVAIVVIGFVTVGDINTLAPIVTMPFLLTYACIDYSYFALAQTFDIQTKREERFRIQAASPLYETRQHYGATNHHENDLDQLFPERTRHKNLSSPENTPYHQQRVTPQPSHGTNSVQDEVIIRDPSINSNNVEGETGDADDEPIAPIRPPIHQKTKNWYSGFCNRWASLMGAGIKIFIMMLVNWVFALICITVVFVVWFYVGTANPAVKPGIADEFRLFVWLKGIVFQCFGKKVHDYEQVIVTPHVNVNLTQTQLNEENEDFSSRRRYHQTGTVTGQLIEDI